MKQRALAADLSGGKASAPSLTPRRINFAPEDARVFKSGLFSGRSLCGMASPEGFWFSLFPVLKAGGDAWAFPCGKC